MGETVGHLAQRMDDEVDGRAKRLGDRQLANEPVLGLLPIADTVGQALIVDDIQKIEVRLVAPGHVRLIDPAAAGVRTVEDDLENAALLLPVLGRKRDRLAEFLE